MKVVLRDVEFKETGKTFDIPALDIGFLKKHDEKGESYIKIARTHILSEIVRWQLAKKRSGNAYTKTRSDVSATTRKPFAQKEVGRARQGSLVGPHQRGGGVVFGPHPRSYEYKLNKKYRKLALRLVLQDKLNVDEIIILDSFHLGVVKTHQLDSLLKKNNMSSVLFVGNVLDGVKRSAANLVNVDVLPVIGLNVLSCLRHKTLVFDLAAIKDVLEFIGETSNA